MSKLSRDKGARGERELAKLFREYGFEDCRRGVQYRGTSDSPDVIGLPGCHVECKRTNDCRPYPWLDKAVAEAAPGMSPVVFHRRDNRPWIVILPAEHFLQILHQAEYGK